MTTPTTPCDRCGRPAVRFPAGSYCDACIAGDSELYYSRTYHDHVEAQLLGARRALSILTDRGIGSDRVNNPTKGKARLNDARATVKMLEGSLALIRSVLVDRGDVTATLEEELARAFPNAKNNESVSWKGRTFRHKWIHDGYDRQGNNLWSRSWTEEPLS